MPTLIVHTQDGDTERVTGDAGDSIMETLVDNDIDGIDAICGGSLSCATCHIVIDENWYGKVGAPGETEAELLKGVNDLRSTSRLSCQIKLSDELDGLELSVPSS